MAGKKVVRAKESKHAVAPLVKESKVSDSALPEIDDDLELKKARGETDSQKAMKKYHEGEFQSHDPTSGQKRDKDDAGF